MVLSELKYAHTSTVGGTFGAKHASTVVVNGYFEVKDGKTDKAREFPGILLRDCTDYLYT
jgi:hypothetical protein